MRPILFGTRVQLAPLERGHLPLRVAYINDPDVQATLNFDYPTSLARTEAWFQRNVVSSDRIDFAVDLKEEHRTIGFGGLLNINRAARKAEFYIFIGDKDVWGRGYGKDTQKLIVNYGFQELGLERIYLHHLLHNDRAIAITLALGWTFEGVLRRNAYAHGILRDQHIASILRHEWEQNPLYDQV